MKKERENLCENSLVAETANTSCHVAAINHHRKIGAQQKIVDWFQVSSQIVKIIFFSRLHFVNGTAARNDHNFIVAKFPATIISILPSRARKFNDFRRRWLLIIYILSAPVMRVSLVFRGGWFVHMKAQIASMQLLNLSSNFSHSFSSRSRMKLQFMSLSCEIYSSTAKCRQYRLVIQVQMECSDSVNCQHFPIN